MWTRISIPNCPLFSLRRGKQYVTAESEENEYGSRGKMSKQLGKLTWDREKTAQQHWEPS